MIHAVAARTLMAIVLVASSTLPTMADQRHGSVADGTVRERPARAPHSWAAPLLVQATVYGERCVTKIGWCPIAPQPVGSPCKCGDVTGTTLQ